MIFSLVVGYQFLHLFYLESQRRFCHTICTVTESEDEVFEQFLPGHICPRTNSSAEYRDISFRDRHDDCISRVLRCCRRASQPAFSFAGESPKPMLSLSLLGACRQAYEEANLLLWTTNTFSFQDASTLSVFCNRLLWTQKKKISKLHIDFAWNWRLTMECLHSLAPSLICRLNGLRTFHLTIDRASWEILAQRILPYVRGLQVLPLQHVTVVLDNGMPSWPNSLLAPRDFLAISQSRKLALSERRELAGDLRSNLLDPSRHGNPDSQDEITLSQVLEARKKKMNCLHKHLV